MANIWLDEQGRVLVNEDGHPYYTDECCCYTGPEHCYMLYVDTCIDSAGNPVYGEGATGNEWEAHWDEPVCYRQICGTPPSDAEKPWDVWHMISPGTATMYQVMTWTPSLPDDPPSGELTCFTSYREGQIYLKYCALSSEGEPIAVCDTRVGVPAFPCSCLSIWGSDVVVDPPHYVYDIQLAKWTFLNEGQPVGSAFTEVWQNGGFPPVSEYPATFDSWTVDISPEYRSHCTCYIANYQAGPLGGPDLPGDTSWQSSQVMTKWYTVGSYSVLNVPFEGWFVSHKYRSGWDEPYVPLAFGGSSYVWMSNNTVYMPEVVLDGYHLSGRWLPTISAKAVGNYKTMVSSVYSTCFQPYAPQQFAHDEWGFITAVFSASTDNNDVRMHVVREARGALVTRAGIPCTDVHIGNNPAGQRLEGSPHYYFRPYILTEFDLEDYNSQCYGHAAYKKDPDTGDPIPEPEPLIRNIQFSGMFCPAYAHLFVTEEWYGCDNTHRARPFPFASNSQGTIGPELAPCQSLIIRTVVTTNPARYPYPDMWPGSAVSIHTSDRTYWMIEADESLDMNDIPEVSPPLVRVSTDHPDQGHAYQVIKLDIANYPQWYISSKCSSALNPLELNGPKPAFEDQLWYQYVKSCQNWHAEWPYQPSAWMTSVTTTFPQGIPVASHYLITSYRQVNPIDYVGKPVFDVDSCTVGSEYASVLTSALGETWVSGSGYVVTVPEGWFESGQGCPYWHWVPVLGAYYQLMTSALITSNGQEVWAACTSPAIVATYNHSLSYEGETLIWDGHVYDPAQCCAVTPVLSCGTRNYDIPVGNISNWSSSSYGRVTSGRYTSLGMYVVEFPHFSCWSGSAYAMTMINSSLVSRLLAGEFDPTLPLPESNEYQCDEWRVPAGATLVYTVYEYAYESAYHTSVVTWNYDGQSGGITGRMSQVDGYNWRGECVVMPTVFSTVLAYDSPNNVIGMTVLNNINASYSVYRSDYTLWDMYERASSLYLTLYDSGYQRPTSTQWTSNIDWMAIAKMTRTENLVGSHGWYIGNLGNGAFYPAVVQYGAPNMEPSAITRTMCHTVHETHYTYNYQSDAWLPNTSDTVNTETCYSAGTGAWCSQMFNVPANSYTYQYDWLDQPLSAFCWWWPGQDIATMAQRKIWLNTITSADSLSLDVTLMNSYAATGVTSATYAIPGEGVVTTHISSWREHGECLVSMCVSIILPSSQQEEDI